MKIQKNQKRREDLLYLSPGVLVLGTIFVIPLLYAIGITFVRWTLIRPELGISFVGLQNYMDVLADPFTYEVLGRTILFLICAVAIEMVLGMVIATVLNWGYNGALTASVNLPHPLYDGTYCSRFFMAFSAEQHLWASTETPSDNRARILGIHSIVG